MIMWRRPAGSEGQPGQGTLPGQDEHRDHLGVVDRIIRVVQKGSGLRDSHRQADQGAELGQAGADRER